VKRWVPCAEWEALVKVLVAEDNANNRQLMEDVLSNIGYQIILAVDGIEAFDLIHQEMPDLVILDVNMPGMNGFEVCERLKTNPETSSIPVLMLSALSDVENRVRGLGLGADDYLTKPFSPRELIARVDKRLQAKAETDGLRERQAMIRSTFERFVSPSVVGQLLENPLQVKLGGNLQEMTVLFADLQGFTPISERAEPNRVLEALNKYLKLIVDHVVGLGGTLDKYTGDGAMALFSVPLPQEDHALRAVRAAIRVRDALPELHKEINAHFRTSINFGIHTGAAIAGIVGVPQFMDYTAIGDTVNTASRLQALAEDGEILISRATYSEVARHIDVRLVGLRNVKGRTEPVQVYSVTGELKPR
jgi:class 3 adenylate cyclase